MSSNSHGLPIAARPTMTASQPVSSSIRRASSGVSTSPLPVTGMVTTSLTRRITDQSALPVKPCEA